MAAKEAPSELIRAKDVAVFDRWAIPSFDPEVEEPAPAPEAPAEPEPEPQIEEVAVEDVKPLTLEEVEAIRQDAYNEGFAAGEKDGFHAGQIKARQEAEPVLAARVAQLEQLMQHLLDKGIPCAIYYPIPLHAQKAYLDARYKEEDFPVTNQLVKEVISLPMHTELEDDQIAFITKSILEFLS